MRVDKAIKQIQFNVILDFNNLIRTCRIFENEPDEICFNKFVTSACIESRKHHG